MGLSGAKIAATPLETNIKLTTVQFDVTTGLKEDTVLQDVRLYQRLIGKLMYVTTTRPDISYAIKTCQFMQQPKRSHWDVALRVVRYMKGSPGQGIWLRSEVSTEELTCQCDSYWAACPKTRRSVTGYVIKFGESLITWK